MSPVQKRWARQEFARQGCRTNMWDRDLADRQKADHKYRALLDAAPDAMVLADERGLIVIVNSQAERLFLFERSQMIGQPVEMLLPSRLRHSHLEHRTQYWREPRVRPMGTGQDLVGIRQDGTEFPVEISLSPIDLEEGRLVCASIRDATPQRLIQQKLRDKNLELERASQAKDQFLASMSHELRTPLNAVIGFAGTLLMRLPGPLNDDQEQQLRMIQRSGRHLLSLINDLLDVAKINAGKADCELESVECGVLLVEVVETLRLQATEKGLHLALHVPAEPMFLQSDRRSLTQIVMNLLANAIKFTPSGRVDLTLSRSVGEEGEITRIAVTDTGPGIAAEDQTRLFEPFARVRTRDRSAPSGTGLGLHLSARLATVIGGRITVESATGAGSTFTLLIRS